MTNTPFTSTPSLADVAAHAKQYGFIFPSSELYGGLRAVYDYGPLGYLLKERIRQAWQSALVQGDASVRIVPMDAAIFMHQSVWKASGHLDLFDDFFVDNKDSKKRYRVDELLEQHIQDLTAQQEVHQAQQLNVQVQEALQQGDITALGQLLKGVSCPQANTSNWTVVRRMHLMFGTQASATQVDEQVVYLRPETAQGIYTNFLNIQQSMRLHLPFGVAQVGKAFRNELITRQFILRTKEFEQMEMQWFVSPNDTTEWLAYWKKMRQQWYLALGFDPSRLHIKKHEKLAHYAQDAYDIEYEFPFGRKEIEGLHHRGNYDLTKHQQASGKNLQCFDIGSGKNVLPEVIETSAGLNRLCLAVLFEAWRKQEGDSERLWLAFPPALAPVQVGVFPLVKKDGLAPKAKEIANVLNIDWQVQYEESGSIGKRYARQDAIGTPYCLTIDHQTITDNTLTLRHRDSTQQVRMTLEEVQALLQETCSLSALIKGLRTVLDSEI